MSTLLPRRAETAAFRSLIAPAGSLPALTLVLRGLAAVVELVPYAGVWLLVRELLDGAERGAVLAIVGLVGGAAVLGFLLRMGAYTVSHRADVRVQAAVRRRVAGHLATLPLGWFAANTGGSTLDALQGDAEELHNAVAHGRLEMTAALVTPIAALAWLVTVDWRLSLLVVLPTVAVHRYQQRVLNRAAERVRASGIAAAGLIDATTELSRDIATLRVTGRGEGAQRRMTAAADELRDRLEDAYEQDTLKVQRSNTLVDSVAMLVLVLAAGTALVAAGWAAPLDVLPFVLLAAPLSAPVQDVALARARMRQAHQAADRIRALLDEPPMPWPEAADVPAGHRVEMRGVTFGYGAEPVLHDIDLTLEPGTVTALVGPSGAGKSTLAALVARFHDVDAGAVAIGGLDVRDHTEDALYRKVGFVFQDAALLRTTLRDNIRLAHPDAGDAQVAEAAQAAEIHDRIAALPDGYDTVFGEDAELSGGERQRVAVARALLADPDVLILDEPTAHVDPETEARIQTALSRLARDRTVLVIAHRLATTAGADQIVVLDHGRVAQRGRHDDLVGVPGLYRDLWRATGEQVNA